MKILFVILILVISEVTPQTTRLECQYIIDGNDYICNLILINPNGFDNFTHVEGTHLLGRGNDDVKTIQVDSISNSPIVPSIICDSFRNPRDIRMRGIGLRRIGENAFRNCTTVWIIELSDNHIEELHEDAFVGNLEVISLEFHANRISRLPEKLLRNNKELMLLELGNNLLSYVDPRVFSGLPNLLSINFWRNRFEKISENNFIELSGLTSLTLSSNLLTYLPENAFNGLQNLQRLDLGWNKLSYLQDNIFENLSSLLHLELTSNPLQKLATNSFSGLRNLQSLQMDYCELQYLDPNLFKNLQSLEEINLNRNEISELPRGLFTDLKNLISINLEINQLAIIDSTSFGVHSNLIFANFANNRIDAIDEKFIDNTNLTGISMMNNICFNGFINDYTESREVIRRELRRCFENFKGMHSFTKPLLYFFLSKYFFIVHLKFSIFALMEEQMKEFVSWNYK